ncbi:hypothetical protein [Dactylosporangium sp. NPDC051541]|uniref:hypothetical protein n=1 Tax=Dactylosporangium sp. NPDC051541 TaxID=3363977 RepID=UPI0037A135DE
MRRLLFAAVCLALLVGAMPAALAAEAQYDLTVTLIDRDGRPAAAGDSPSLRIYNLDNADIQYWGDAGTVRLPAGRYAVHASIQTKRAGLEDSYSFISNPELRLDRDRAQTLDARIGRPVSITAPDPRARGGGWNVLVFTQVKGAPYTFADFQEVDPRFNQVFAATVPGVAADSYAFGQARSASEPKLELFAGGAEVRVDWLTNSQPPAGEGKLTAVYGGHGTAEELAKVDVRDKAVVLESPVASLAAAKAAGARLVVINGEDELAEEPALPTMVASGPTAERFVESVKKSRMPLWYSSRPTTSTRYELAYGTTKQISGDQVFKPRIADLAAVPTAYYDNAPNAARFLSASVPFFGTTLRVVFSNGTAVPQERVEYFTPGTWTLTSSGYGNPSGALQEVRTLQAGTNPRVDWDKAVIGPTFRGTTRTREDGERPWAWRKNGAMDVVLPMFGDSAGRPRTPVPGVDSGTISLYRNGTLVDTVDAPNAARIAVPDEIAQYRLTADVHRAADWWPLSTSVSAEWTFRSSAADEGKTLPLLTARFDPKLDLHNRAPGGRTFTFPVFVAPRCTNVQVDISYDDGRTWKAANIARAGAGWLVTVQHPARGYASLRATASDEAGNAVRQTVLRAYQIGV